MFSFYSSEKMIKRSNNCETNIKYSTPCTVSHIQYNTLINTFAYLPVGSDTPQQLTETALFCSESSEKCFNKSEMISFSLVVKVSISKIPPFSNSGCFLSCSFLFVLVHLRTTKYQKQSTTILCLPNQPRFSL